MSKKIQFVYPFPGRTVPAIPELLSARALTELALLAESIGISAVALDDHPIPPEAWRQDPAGHDAIDPFSGLAAVAAATRKLRLFVFAAVVPYRNPFLLAKQAATLDVLSEGRLMLGLVAGYLPAESAALGVDFATRNAAFDEAVEVMKLAWRGEPVTYKGRNFTAEAVTAHPCPIQRPHPPLWFGGNSQVSLRRVIKHGAGWASHPNARSLAVSRHAPFLETVDDFKGYLAHLKQMAAEAGRTEPFSVMYFTRDPADPSDQLRAIRELQELDVSCWSLVHGVGRTLAEAKDALRRFGDEVLAKL